tara:strand:+ start:2284 stop:2775 length:492 start_codon:yes stop_codon:yes gene_type:complete
MNKREMLILGFVLFAVVIRLIPHPPNFTPITALALFGSTTFRNKWFGLLLPIIAMGISDLYLGFYSISIWVYSSFFLISLLGLYWKKIQVKNVFISSLIFFIITNFGVWLGGYPKTIEGFLLCYTMAIPFFLNSILGDFFFSYLLKFSFGYSENKLMLGSSNG